MKEKWTQTHCGRGNAESGCFFQLVVILANLNSKKQRSIRYLQTMRTSRMWLIYACHWPGLSMPLHA